MKVLLMRHFHLRQFYQSLGKRYLRQSATGIKDVELNLSLKHSIETHWHTEISSGKFDNERVDNKFYVLPMFPYPSGSLHMGHVRVYTISDAMARFYRMCNKNVFHPMGWDAFGLPAENAAIERGIEPAAWTAQNTAHMKEQLMTLGCSFDWEHELSTCQPDYYKWTQKLFLMLHKDGMAYQNEALVNWDPVDQTVLADEQVDANNRSWRSGAKVEKKLLKQWFIRTSVFAKRLWEGLEDPALRDWKDIKTLQRHWIGDCNGYAFQLATSAGTKLRVWTANPEYFKDPRAFLVLRTQHHLSLEQKTSLKVLNVENPFAGSLLPVVFSDEVPYPAHCDVYLASPSNVPTDLEFLMRTTHADLKIKNMPSVTNQNALKARSEVIEAAVRSRIGGHQVSSKLQDWLVSRQRYWGTPIPIVHCPKCGAVPVPEEQLPVILPDKRELLRDREKALRCSCPKCQSAHAHMESDTMDTFVDSSWYYLRFIDAHNQTDIFDKTLVSKCMPVDLYIGGKEHAVLHLYYARFINHYLHSRGLVPTAEPFSRLLVQGMVMGRSYRVKKTGKYVTEDQVVVDAKKNIATLRENMEPVVMNWEKMSKSKFNGVDPMKMFTEYGTDTTRLIILADVAPTSHRNWSSATFPGILNWQKRLWLTLTEFIELRSTADKIDVNINETLQNEWEEKMKDARNYYIKGATFNYRHTHQLSVAISKMQGLTNSLRRTPKALIAHLKQYERALAAQIMMLAPMAPAFASELWAKFAAANNRLNVTTDDWQWDMDVLQQKWPEVDVDYKLDLTIKINAFENCAVKITRKHLDGISHNDAMKIALNTHSVTEYLSGKTIGISNFVLYPGLEAVLNIYLKKEAQKVKSGEVNIADGDKLG